MRIHTNLNFTDFQQAVHDGAAAGVQAETLREYGSRKRGRAFEVGLSGNSTRRRQDGKEYAATWDEWGMVLAAIFAADPEATCDFYADARDFHYKTNWRYAGGGFDDCPNHRWKFHGIPRTQDCTKCGAIRRF